MAESNVTAIDPDAAPCIERDIDATIYQRLWLASGELGQLEKDGKVDIGKSGYEYISHDLVTANAKAAFQKYGIMVLPTVKDHQKDGNRSELTVSVDFINIDDPDDRVTTEAVGYGVDTSDKGPGKAYSYAMKYAYLKVLMLNSADDIELDEIEHEPAGNHKEMKEVQERDDLTIQSWAATFKRALETAQDLKELKRIWGESKPVRDRDDFPTVTRQFFEDTYADLKTKFEGDAS